MNASVIEANPEKITEREISELKEKIADQKRVDQYNKLKADLEDISYRAANTNNEFQSAMQSPDTDRVLQSRKGKDNFINLFIARVQRMCSPRPAVGNFIALGITLAVLFLMRSGIVTHIGSWDVSNFLPYLGYLALASGALQIIKSATRTLLIPLLALIIGGLITASMGQNDIVMSFGKEVYSGMFVCGIIGLIIASFSID